MYTDLAELSSGRGSCFARSAPTKIGLVFRFFFAVLTVTELGRVSDILPIGRTTNLLEGLLLFKPTVLLHIHYSTSSIMAAGLLLQRIHVDVTNKTYLLEIC